MGPLAELNASASPQRKPRIAWIDEASNQQLAREDSEKDLVNLDVVPTVVVHRTKNPALVRPIIKGSEARDPISQEVSPPAGRSGQLEPGVGH